MSQRLENYNFVTTVLLLFTTLLPPCYYLLPLINFPTYQLLIRFLSSPTSNLRSILHLPTSNFQFLHLRMRSKTDDFINEKDPIKMIDFMLKQRCGKIFCTNRHWLRLFIIRLNNDSTMPSNDPENSWYGQTSFFALHFLLACW